MTAGTLNPAILSTPGALLGAPQGIALNQSSGPLSPQKMAAAKTAAKNFEAFFATSMLESMYAGVKPDAMFGGGPGEEMYRSMLNQEYGKSIAARGSMGIAQNILSEMIRLQEKH
jgi:peptidoglycan hydrolase FlgJ